MRFLPISNDLNKIRKSLGISQSGRTKTTSNVKSTTKVKDTETKEEDPVPRGYGCAVHPSATETGFHEDWQLVPYVSPENSAFVYKHSVSDEEDSPSESDSASDSEDTEDGTDNESRSSEESDSDLDGFLVDDDHKDTDDEEDEDEDTTIDVDTPPSPVSEEDANMSEKKKRKKKAMKTELENLAVSSGKVGERGFAVASSTLGKRTRRQTDHLAPRVFEAAECKKEIDCYDSYDHENKRFKKEAYHRHNSTKALWKGVPGCGLGNKGAMAIGWHGSKSKDCNSSTGTQANWVQRAKERQMRMMNKCGKTKAGRRPMCTEQGDNVAAMKKKQSDMRSYFCKQSA